MITFKKQNIRKKHGSSKLVAFGVFFTVIFACLFLLQEQTYAVSCYTDTWVDDSGVSDHVYNEGEEIDGPYIVGSGVTSMNYYEPYHDAVVITTLTSPSGQQISLEDFDVSENYKPFSARAEVELLWSDNEVGTYTINSEHRSYCPYTNFGSTNASLPISIARDAYELFSEVWAGGRFGYGACDYEATCYGFCSLTTFGVAKVNPQNCPRYAQCRTLVVRGSCLNRAKICVYSPTRGTCSS